MPAPFAVAAAASGPAPLSIPNPWLMRDFHSFCAAFCKPDEAFERCAGYPKGFPLAP
jgi:hypothetical protein